jgi:hypothetical protein
MVILTTKSLSNADGARQPLSNRIFSIARTKSLSFIIRAGNRKYSAHSLGDGRQAQEGVG